MSYQRGYTLVELLIVVTIAGILLTVGAGAYSRAQRRQVVKAAAETILSSLQSAQKASAIGDKDCSGALLGFRVSHSAGGNALTTTAVCQGGSGSARVISLQGLEFTSSGDYLFRPLGDGVYIGGSDSGNTDFEVEGSSTTYRVSVAKSGTIRYVGEQ